MDHTPIEKALDDAQRSARQRGVDYVVYHSDKIGWCAGRAMPGDEKIEEFIIVHCPRGLRQ